MKKLLLLMVAILLGYLHTLAFDQYERMKVGETKTFYFPSEVTSRSGSMYSYNCSSDHINNIEVVGYTKTSVTVKALAYIASTVHIRFDYWWSENGYNRTDTHMVNIDLSDGSGPDTDPDLNPDNYFYDNGKWGDSDISVKVGSTKTLYSLFDTPYEDKVKSIVWSSVNSYGYEIVSQSWNSCTIKGTNVSSGEKLYCLMKYGNSTYKAYYIVKVLPADVVPTSISLPSSASVFEGSSMSLSPTITPSNATTKLTWTSSNTSVATVSDGTVRGVSPGTATITVKTSNNISASCTVTVKSATVYPTKITLPASRSVQMGNTITLTPTITPSNATYSLTWSSSNTSIATVSSSGVVQGITPGTVRITVTTSNGLSDYCDVTVTSTDPTSISLPELQYVNIGESKLITPTMQPSNAFTTLSWESDDENIVTVSKSGIIKGISEGETYLWVRTSNGLSAWCTIIVSPVLTNIEMPESLTLIEDSASITLTPSFIPANARPALTYSSDNTSIATVSSTGVITPIQPGRTTIRVTDNNGVSATCQVIVKESPYIIHFADVTTQSICIANWDKNGNGKLSYEEAAAVTSLGTVFKSNSSIKTFDELQYFTNLTSISDSAFQNCRNLTSIAIPNSVKYIGNLAFLHCKGLTSIDIPNTVESIGEFAFQGCSAIKSMHIPNSTRSIGKYAISRCYSLSELTLPEQLGSIEEGLCWENSTLTTITIPICVTSIGISAFESCSGLTSITIPNSVDSIGNGAFSSCSGLTSVTTWIEPPFNIDNSAFSVYTSVTLNVPYGTKSQYEACEGWKEFKNIVEMDPDYAIQFADNIVKAICVANWDTNGNGRLSYEEAAAVTSLGTVFRQNSSIKSFDELQYFTNLTSICDSAFQNCSNLTSITIPNSVKSIGNLAFLHCRGLTSIVIPNTVESIGEYAFQGCSAIKSMHIPNSTKSIGKYAISLCSSLSELTLPEQLESIDEGLCCADSTLTRINIPNTVESIGEFAFQGCSAIKSMHIPNSTRSIGKYAISRCYSLSELTLPEQLGSIEEGLCWENSTLTTIRIPNSVTSIGNSAFYDCSGLTSITIPNTVDSIGEYAFYGCSAIKSMHIPNSIKSIGKYAISQCTNLSELTLPEQLISIEEGLCWNDSTLTTITIPNNVASIGKYAFSDCNGLTSIDIPKSVTSIGNWAYYGCSGLTFIRIPNRVTSIGYGTFSGCSGITSIVVDENNNKYDSREGSNAIIETETNKLISGCKKTVVPNSVTCIDYCAFYDCNSLTFITIPNSVTSIDEYAFSDCNGLTTIISMIETPFNIDNSAFSVYTTATLYVPKGTKALYEACEGWKEFNEIVEINPTDINEIQNNGSVESPFYTIDGKKIMGRPVKKGVYIQNGKKVLLK